MKVVLFCGGQGLRLREFSEALPKPMVPIGPRPIIWHLMKYYAHYGHRDFILCLGHKADIVKNYFRNYDETVSNDFVLREGGRKVELLNSDIQDWNITFVDTGMHANIGQRLRAVRQHLKGEQWLQTIATTSPIFRCQPSWISPRRTTRSQVFWLSALPSLFT